MDSLLAWYQRKISTYDLQVWERAVELKEQNGLSVTHKKESSIKPELIDVDLVRGSMFSKNKPHYSIGFVTCIGMLRVVLFPIFIGWWSNQTSRKIAAFFLFLYCINVATIYVYVSANEDEMKNIHHYEVIMPIVNALIIGGMHCQVVSTNFKPIEAKNKNKDKTKWRTLSSALLEPVTSGSHQNTMTFVQSAIGDVLTNHENKDPNTKQSETFVQSSEDCDGRKRLNQDRSKKSHQPRDASSSYWQENNNSSDSDMSLSADEDSDQNSDGNDTRSDNENENERKLSATALLPCTSPTMKYITARIWEAGVCKKAQVSLLDIGGAIMLKAKNCPVSTELFWISLFFSLCVAFIPIVFRVVNQEYSNDPSLISLAYHAVGGEDWNWKVIFFTLSTLAQRFFINVMFVFMLCVAFRTYKQRFLFAKYFAHLTSSRKAKKSDLPHFRLHKVENVRLWLSLRSYIRRRGPQRSVDVIVSTSFMLLLCFICFVTIQLLHNANTFMTSLLCWDATIWLLMLAVFMLKFITLGVHTNQKYRTISVLIIEQINLYLQMEQKPHKKEELQRANAVLSLATKLLKEIERPFNIHGLAMNPLLYNIMKVVVLSAFSGVISEMLGFKLKIWKIKA